MGFRPHCLHAVHKMRVAWSGCLSLSLSVSVWVLGTRLSCAKTAEPIEMPLGGGVIHVGSRNHVLNGVKNQDRTNPFAAERGDKMAMRFFTKLLLTLVELSRWLS